jgi:hypothetical protein
MMPKAVEAELLAGLSGSSDARLCSRASGFLVVAVGQIE